MFSNISEGRIQHYIQLNNWCFFCSCVRLWLCFDTNYGVSRKMCMLLECIFALISHTLVNWSSLSTASTPHNSCIQAVHSFAIGNDLGCRPFNQTIANITTIHNIPLFWECATGIVLKRVHNSNRIE